MSDLIVITYPDEESGRGAFDSLEKFGGSIYQTSLSTEDEEKLKKALEHEQVSASAREMLELE